MTTSVGGKQQPSGKKQPTGPTTGYHTLPAAFASMFGATNPSATLGVSGSPDVMAAKDTAKANDDTAGQNLSYGLGELNRTYGVDATGAIDPNNPYGRAALALSHYQDNQAMTTNSYALRGLSNSGAVGARRSRDYRNYDVRAKGLGNEYAGGIKALLSTYLDTRNQSGTTVSGAAYGALLDTLIPKGGN